MSRRRPAIAGRTREGAALDAALADAADDGLLAVLRGPAGVGKSALLNAAAQRWRAAGVQVLAVSFASAGAADGFGFRAVLEAVREQFEDVGGPRVVESISAMSALSSPVGGQTVGLVLEFGTMIEAIVAGRPTAIVVDAADAIAAPALALRAAVRPGCLVVAAVRDARGLAARQLDTVADRVLDLDDLPPEDVEAMLARRYGAPVDDGLRTALATALGRLAGHPGTIMSTMDSLDREGRLAIPRGTGGRPRGHLCLVDPAAPIALAPDHALVARVNALGPTALRLATTAAVGRFGVDDLPLLAEATDGDLDHYGHTLDALVAGGVLTADPHGAIEVACPALGTRLVREVGPTAVARLHRAYAAAMFRRVGYGGPADLATLADHVTSAGPTIPVDRRTAAGLAEVADRAAAREPARAAQWLRAALRHADGGRAANQILHRLLRLLVRTGEYGLLGDVVTAVAAREALVAPTPRQREDLAAAAMLAAVHTGVPIPESTVEALAGDTPGSRDPFDFCARWFGSGHRPGRRPTRVRVDPGPDPTEPPLLSAAELDLVVRLDGRTEELLAAGSTGDLVTVFQLVLGPRYGAPGSGALAAYRRLLDLYARGEFGAALSAARELELSGPAVTPAHHGARAFAAEMSALLGEAARATRWLEPVPPAPPYLALRWWAAHGSTPPPEVPGALRAGRRAYERQRAAGSPLGTEQLLVRLAELAVRVEGPHEALDALPIEPVSGETALLLQAARDRDPEPGRAAADRARARGHRPALVAACLVTASLADDPRAWLTEAYEAARPFGSTHLRTRISALMRERGVRRPRIRPPRDAFSPTETEIIDLIRQGWTNRQIAVRVRMSEKTVETHLTRLFARTGCRSRVELATASLTGPGLGAAS